MPRIIIGGELPAHTTVHSGGGTYDVDIVAFTPNPEVTFQGPGTYSVNIGASLFTSYTVEAKNGAVVNINSTGDLLTTANLVVNGASTIEIGEEYSALTSTNAQFVGTGGTLTFTSGKLAFLDSKPVVSGFATGDYIDFGSAYQSGDKVVYTAGGGDRGTLTLESANGKPIGAVTLVGPYTEGDFNVIDKGGIAEIVGCFLRGTRILTSNGEVAVEHLREGDMVMTLSNGLKQVKAVRLRSFTRATEISSPNIRPVRIAAGALAEGVPHRDLLVSPDHSIYLDGVLVPAQLLVNDETITHPASTRAVDYYHVEIEPHDVIIAEGAATESYLDIGNMGHFLQPGVISLFPSYEPKNWEDACAPLVLAGPQLAAIQAKLLSRAMELEDKQLARVA